MMAFLCAEVGTGILGQKSLPVGRESNGKRRLQQDILSLSKVSGAISAFEFPSLAVAAHPQVALLTSGGPELHEVTLMCHLI